MRHEPHALKGRHQGLAMNFRLQEIDEHEDQGHQSAETQYPTVAALGIEHSADDGEEERIPEAGLPHRLQRRTAETDP